MRAIVLGTVGVLIALAAVGVPSQAPAESSGVQPPAREPGQPPWEYRLADVCVELETHSLSRQCPLHLVAITGDGSGTWGCEDSDEDPLRFTVTEDEVLDLLSRVYSAYFFHMPPRYASTLEVVVGEDGLARVLGTGVAGGQWRVLTVTIDDYSKRVEATNRYPEELGELIDFILGFADRAAEQLGGRPSN